MPPKVTFRGRKAFAARAFGGAGATRDGDNREGQALCAVDDAVGAVRPEEDGMAGQVFSNAAHSWILSQDLEHIY